MPHDDNLKQHPGCAAVVDSSSGQLHFHHAAAFHHFQPNIQSHLGQIVRRPSPMSIDPGFFVSLFRAASHQHEQSRPPRPGGNAPHDTPLSHPSFRILSSNRGFSLLCSPHWRFDDPMAPLHSTQHYEYIMLHSRPTSKKKFEKLIAILTRSVSPAPDPSGASDKCGVESSKRTEMSLDVFRRAETFADPRSVAPASYPIMGASPSAQGF